MEDLQRAFERAALLPDDKQVQVVDFIEFLVAKYVADNRIDDDVQEEENLFEFLDRSVEEMKENSKRLNWEEIKNAE